MWVNKGYARLKISQVKPKNDVVPITPITLLTPASAKNISRKLYIKHTHLLAHQTKVPFLRDKETLKKEVRICFLVNCASHSSYNFVMMWTSTSPWGGPGALERLAYFNISRQFPLANNSYDTPGQVGRRWDLILLVLLLPTALGWCTDYPSLSFPIRFP